MVAELVADDLWSANVDRWQLMGIYHGGYLSMLFKDPFSPAVSRPATHMHKRLARSQWYRVGIYTAEGPVEAG